MMLACPLSQIWTYDPPPSADALGAPAGAAVPPGTPAPEAELPPRLLRSRAGHRAPPTRLHFFGDDSLHLLGAGADGALRLHHTVCLHKPASPG